MMLPQLSPRLREEMALIEPSIADRGDALYPCSLLLRNGTILESVYLTDSATFLRRTGLKHPADDSDRQWISPNDVASIRESPKRLPAKYASEIYQAGESGMDYWVFTVVFSRWSRREYVTSSPDFVDYPRGKGPSNVLAVIPHVGRRLLKLRSQPNVYWCVFSPEVLSGSETSSVSHRAKQKPGEL
jgi:hypothetical protein